jgi:cyclase
MIESPLVPEHARSWRDEIARHGAVRYLINIEPHIDHFAGNCFFEGTVVGHDGTREAIRAAAVADLEKTLKQMAPQAAPLSPQFHFRPPSLTLSQRLTIHLGDHTFKVISLPGHTPYQLAVYIPEERVVFTGDNVVNGAMPFLQQALPDAWLNSLQALQKLEIDRIVPGHGDICDKNQLEQMSTIIKAWIEAVKQALKKGLSLAEAQDRISLVERFPVRLGKDFIRWTERENVARLYALFNNTGPEIHEADATGLNEASEGKISKVNLSEL